MRAASLFRGVSSEDFEKHIRRIFFTLKERWNGVPFEVVNDGEVTALAGSMALEANAVLGVAMGTSEAAGYVDPDGHIKPWLNELAFAPVDYRDDAPARRVVGRHRLRGAVFLAAGGGAAGAGGGLRVRRDALPRAAGQGAGGDEGRRRAGAARSTRRSAPASATRSPTTPTSTTIENLMVLGRVTSGEGGEVIIAEAGEGAGRRVSRSCGVKLVVPDEKTKRHGQAVAAASLAAL